MMWQKVPKHAFMPCPSMWPKQFWSVQNGFGHDQNEMVTTKINWSGPNVIHWSHRRTRHKCPEIYLWSKFWQKICIINIRSWLGFAQKHIWNMIEEIVFERSRKVQFWKTISSIMLQICFWASPSGNLVFEISKIMQNFY